jgi:hypothetical protein
MTVPLFASRRGRPPGADAVPLRSGVGRVAVGAVAGASAAVTATATAVGAGVVGGEPAGVPGWVVDIELRRDWSYRAGVGTGALGGGGLAVPVVGVAGAPGRSGRCVR